MSSTGEAEIDRLAVRSVENNWRFLPAMTGGHAIEAWTTVMVRFEPLQ